MTDREKRAEVDSFLDALRPFVGSREENQKLLILPKVMPRKGTVAWARNIARQEAYRALHAQQHSMEVKSFDEYERTKTGARLYRHFEAEYDMICQRAFEAAKWDGEPA